jgi:hypothetical protein
LHAFRSHVEAEGRSARSEEDENADRTLRPKAEAQDRKKKKHNADAEMHRADENAWFRDTLLRPALPADPVVNGTRPIRPVEPANGESGREGSLDSTALQRSAKELINLCFTL